MYTLAYFFCDVKLLTIYFYTYSFCMKWIVFLLMVITLFYFIYSSRSAVGRQISSSTLSVEDRLSPETEIPLNP